MGCSGRQTAFSPCHSVTAMSLTRTPKFHLKKRDSSVMSNLANSPVSCAAAVTETVLIYNVPSSYETE